MNEFLNNLKKSVIENPIPTIIIVIAAVATTAKLIDACGDARGSNAYAKDVNRRCK
jgi:hypothetical protein